MIDRYSPCEMKKLWSQAEKYKRWLKVELSVMQAYAEIGTISEEVVKKAEENAFVDAKKIEETEKAVEHDVIAFIKVATSKMGEEARYFHYGLTSSDIVDTAQSMAMVEAMDMILKKLNEVMEVTMNLAQKYKYTPTVGRTHGIHAETTSFGLKVLNWYAELERARARLQAAKEKMRVGKISGAVGNYANVPPIVEELACKKLGLKPCKISTQVIPRDLHAEYINALAISASGIERIAVEIRHLQRTEVHEVEEPFSSKQRGSSAMPHKKNPIVCERLTGISRLLRSYTVAAMENIALWHERDISHSSVERVIIPDATTIFYYALEKLAYVVGNLNIYEERISENLNLTRGLIYSQRALLKLVEKGMSREDAYLLVQRASMKVWRGEEPDLKTALKKETGVELSDLFDPAPYLKHVDDIFKRFNKS